MQTAEQVVAALTGGVVTTAVNIPAISPEDMEVLGPFVPLCRQLGRLAMSLAEGSVDRPHRGRVPRPHRRARHAPAVGRRADRRARRARRGGRQRRQRAGARRGARHRASPRRSARARATSPTSCASTIVSGDARVRVVGTTLGRRNRPHLLEAWGQRFNLQLEEQHRAVPLPRRAGHDRPRRHGLRRARRQHRLRGRRPRAGRATAAATAPTP